MQQKDTVIFNLNKALQLEYFDVFSYPREANLIKDNVIKSKFEEFGLMEIRHADLLSQRILALGGKPIWDFHLMQGENDLKKIISRHIDYEQRAIDFYADLIKEVDDQTRIFLRGIKSEEEAHLSQLKEFFNFLK